MILLWSEEASNSLAAIYFYILKDSPQNAEKVVSKIIDLAETLINENFEYAIDPIINKQKFRHISVWSYKILYERTADSVIILDVFDGRQNPNKLDKF
nr:type II toxin-antitoxin system RelE/ParE family toxin [uncultured Flavobacterium sp.]